MFFTRGFSNVILVFRGVYFLPGWSLDVLSLWFFFADAENFPTCIHPKYHLASESFETLQAQLVYLPSHATKTPPQTKWWKSCKIFPLNNPVPVSLVVSDIFKNYNSLKLTVRPLKIGHLPKGNDRIRSIDFQGLWRVVGRCWPWTPTDPCRRLGGWKLLHADVFRAPKHRLFFCSVSGRFQYTGSLNRQPKKPGKTNFGMGLPS